jgi:hypothetical protein
MAIKNKESGFFKSGSEALEITGTNIGLLSTQIFRRRQGLLGFDIARKHLVGFSFVSTAVYLSVLAGPGKFYFLNGPYILCHPTTPEEIVSITNRTGEIINNGLNNFLKIAFYVPLRAFPYVRALELNVNDFLYFDDKPGIRGKYYDGCSQSIMSYEDIINVKPDIIIIFSLSFSEAIKLKIKKLNLPIQIYSVDNL